MQDTASPADPSRIRRERSRVAGLTARHGRDSDRARQARADFTALSLEEHIARKLADAPELSRSQLDRLAGLFRSGQAGGAA